MVQSMQNESLEKEKRQRDEQDDNEALLKSKRREIDSLDATYNPLADDVGPPQNGQAILKNKSSTSDESSTHPKSGENHDRQIDVLPTAKEPSLTKQTHIQPHNQPLAGMQSQSFGSFASGSAFGKAQSAGGFASLLSATNSAQPSAFSSLLHDRTQKSSIFDADAKAPIGKNELPGNEDENTDGDADEADGIDEDQYVVVKGLERTTVPTGEEGETCIHLVRAKLYAIDPRAAENGWKERGVGNLRVLQDSEKRTRLVMRADAVLRVILNLPLHPTYKVEHGGESMGEKTIRLFGVEDGLGRWLAIRVSSKKAADELKDLIEKSMRAIPVTNKAPSSPEVQEATSIQPAEVPTTIEGIVEHSSTITTPVQSGTLDSVEATEISKVREIEAEKRSSAL
ncbi:protein of unknown function [Taphrina deformans PYCC 5710]|uniref:RanBD1 domain-containing protein n=1 Tax=Taphrina deformans (strain PYCC 5710 / ATCC 11124 / CBS 356.35 / IMI 108563 / JCM 9778 / NBRC 8474) TaxID=1097556 RepID=R4XFU0_TAPDE|nr:protein of unknown function [Taphrina deformans PYCC 5710]|eukprot:CCG84610.1 protein of unknown function [Taphrina deformans PYCC 5710]